MDQKTKYWHKTEKFEKLENLLTFFPTKYHSYIEIGIDTTADCRQITTKLSYLSIGVV